MLRIVIIHQLGIRSETPRRVVFTTFLLLIPICNERAESLNTAHAWRGCPWVVHLQDHIWWESQEWCMGLVNRIASKYILYNIYTHIYIYCRVICYITIACHSHGTSPLFMGNSSVNGTFSIAVWIYWRVKYIGCGHPNFHFAHRTWWVSRRDGFYGGMIVFVGFLSCKPTATTISGLSTTINPHCYGRIQCPLLCLSMWALLLHPVYL